MKVALHLLVLAIIFVLPELLLSHLSDKPNPRPPMDLYVSWVVYILVFYADYALLFRLLFCRRLPKLKFFVANLLLLAAALTTDYTFMRHDNGGHRPCRENEWARPPKPRGLDPKLMREAVMLILIMALATTLRFTERSRRIERRNRELEAMKRDDEIKGLRSQLNPHFLFNVLNTIYALIAVDGEKAQSAVYKLSKMLRYMIYGSQSVVSVAQELEFINSYIELMRLRLPSAIDLTTEIDCGPLADRTIAPLVFITVVENVFKHGSLRAGDRAEIRITGSDDGMVRAYTENAIAVRDPQKPSGGGIGLTNLRRRLQLLYGDKAELIAVDEDGRFIVDLTVPTGLELPSEPGPETP